MHQMRMRRRIALILVLGLSVCFVGSQVVSAVMAHASLVERSWMNTALTPDQRADQLLAQMTLDEKIALLHGANGSYVGNVPANTRLGIPALNLEDGPAGVGDGMTQVTAFPAPIAGAASWDTALMQQYGQALGSEQMGKGTNVVLGPTVNILRNPNWGRSFESFGEDPYLNGQIAVADINGIQSQYAIATVKHYAANNQEYDRGTVNAVIDERTLHEIYLPAFEAAVQQGQAGAVMCSYNLVNAVYACEQAELLNQVLKQGWGFPGFVMSDWGATHSTVASANAGLDMEMPGASYYGTALATAVANGQVSMDTINDHVHRILRTMFAVGLFDHPTTGSPSNNVASAADATLALQEDEQGSVLLKNNQNALPWNTSQVHSIAVIGVDASVAPQVVGGGSAGVNPPHVVTPLQGITQRAGSAATVQYAQGLDSTGDLPAITTQYLTPPTGGGNGLQAQFFNNMTLSGNPVLTRVDPNLDFNWNGGSPGAGVNTTQWSARWTGTLTAPVTGSYTFTTTSDDGSRLYINNQLLINNWYDQQSTAAGGTIQLTAGQTYTIRAEYYQNGGGSNATLGWNIPGQSSTMFNQAASAAQAADVAVVFVNDHEAEATDRANLELPGAQDQLIEEVAQANPHTIVVLNTGAPVLMPWVNQVQGILEAWYPGQEDGTAAAALLFGDVNPSGKLPMTFPANAGDVPANTPAQYPGINDQAQYSEGVFVGYRYYDKNSITPLFPFGQGLSYTTFSYSNLSITPSAASSTGNVTVGVDVTNSGTRAGAEVAQLYLGIPSTNVPEPPKQLKGFQKVTLQAGASQHLTFTLNPQAMSFWDTSANNWTVPNGTFQVMVGSSSRDIRLQGNFSVSGSVPNPIPTPTPTPAPTPTPTPISGASGVQINAGGSASTPFMADADFSGGATASSTNTIDTGGVTNPAPQSVYQTNRYGNFTYTVPNLTPNASYTIRLHFAETYWTAAGQRTFNVSINGQSVLSAFDIVGAAGAANKAVMKQFTATADGSGTITLQFATVKDNAEVSGIEVLNASTSTPTPTPQPTATPTPTPAGSGLQLNAGGSAAAPFVADADFSGGSTTTSNNTIDTSGATNPAPQSVYQSNRYGDFTYTVPNLTPNKSYTVRLHFAETYWTQAGQRTFNVSINGQSVLSAFDIVGAAGAANKAVVKQFTSTADSAGKITIQFATVKDNAQVNGIEILA